MAGDPNILVWIDMEMTGLQPDSDRIIEIAMLVTDAQLNVLAEGPVLVVHQPDAVLEAMASWNRSTHKKTGLIERVRAARMAEAEAERAALEFLGQHVPAGNSPMCGNSICQDRRFLARWMPKLEAYFHYRNLDVSTLKELARRSSARRSRRHRSARRRRASTRSAAPRGPRDSRRRPSAAARPGRSTRWRDWPPPRARWRSSAARPSAPARRCRPGSVPCAPPSADGRRDRAR